MTTPTDSTTAPPSVSTNAPSTFTWPVTYDGTKTLLAGFTMKWKVTLAANSDQGADEIAVELSGSTTICGDSQCWMAVGFGGTKMSSGADVYLGYLGSDGSPLLTDRKSPLNALPTVDSNSSLLSGSTVTSSGGLLYVRIRRK